ncbi:8-amino-7-oxononanoate synthase [Mesorhizobium sp. M0924]|uniref:8-amino-7-oxononanoate synthase n=1 Tax=unclassified Mesorhizobium TaxID=325217 RepID=UPI0003CF8ACB|nr:MULTISPECIES: 8-amino-7-oxononanoate synthase [unclassified Mesorhizobium]ESW63618.1 8-amino-7-oxononanoate synthase [Mesorhizobium sp. LSJC277A00]ESX40642.1 8-amino-7-oxononanoate synthase [Mesorhizobium sp. LSHC426A00]ESX45240.1 8-amino-7-oxononanoate synthase [Mesorhizobium sp. LSHC424B00]ESX49751.1 8-amino-7-oxononanoate synthase [Mesorhizobium sp. LSHC422A00]ESX64027.1 8-amino-7-oxononanoate synthase [Mesorhizobium sp. LSHC416B00]
MNGAPLARYDATLQGLARKDRLRTLSPRAGLDFSSNDYLGLAASRRLGDAVVAAIARGTPVGATGSRLLRGNAPEHEQLEADAAAFFGADRALFFGSGYIANFALLSALPQKGDLLVVDELAHASMHEGAQAGRAQFVLAAHNDATAVEDAITRWRVAGGMGCVWIAVESLYSMDGDCAPLESLVALADRHGAFIVIDEAHATGVWGPDGRGLAAAFEGRDNIIALHTCGKALGASGGLVTGPRALCEYLINRCRPFIYATAPSPLMAVVAREALAMLADEPMRRVQLHERVASAGRLVNRWGVTPSGSQIQPLVIGDVRRTMAVAARLQARGFDIRGVRPPTVPEGTSRLRISLTLNIGEADISAMVEALVEVFAETSPEAI